MPDVLGMTTQHTLHIGNWILPSVAAVGLVAGCATSGTEPNAMSAPQHQAAAHAEEHAAASHQAKYDPSAVRAGGPTAPSPGAYSACISYESSNCLVRWRSQENPTDQHRKQAEEHKKLAEKHRAASKALVESEQRFCSGIPEADRDLSPFYHREDIGAVQGLKAPTQNYGYLGGGNSAVEIQKAEKETGIQGARVTFRAVPGMTGEWLQRVVDCHLARNAVVGGADMPFCPLAVPHATATVMSTGTGFAVDVTSNNADSVREIIKRASTLVPSGPTASR